MTPAVAYYRTSSATNIDGDSTKRQEDAILSYANANDYGPLTVFWDAAVSGADPVDTRPNFVKMLQYCEENGVKVILCENASRFARDLAVQLAGHAMLKARGIELIPVDAPTYFTDPSPTAELVRQILGAVAQFEKAALVAKLKHARDAKRAATGRCEGRKPTDPFVVSQAKQLRKEGMTLRDISNTVEASPSGLPYSVAQISRMVRS